MHFPTISVALAALTGGAVANICNYEVRQGMASTYAIVVPGVPDIPGVCGGLWDNLKQFADCIGVGSAHCGATDAGELNWKFTNGGSCNPGMVEATWWDATKNEWGAIDCGA
ncbi:hypothetical protein BS50DRAFT_679779 [Corynespora cassiicola Philippines]|uniref:Uncharacterized protein n=1 Tax=Corynespora cassiicola Philippines TaxID=1448308 RepID=A0A2T2NAA3_CORCC|nr:hypothetical protein BS50DRAFT_679779 [Corynespora cassiicola Philippines]